MQDPRQWWSDLIKFEIKLTRRLATKLINLFSLKTYICKSKTYKVDLKEFRYKIKCRTNTTTSAVNSSIHYSSRHVNRFLTGEANPIRTIFVHLI